MQNHPNYGEVVAKAWADESFKERLKQDPHGVLAEHGIEVPVGATVNVVEDTDTEKHFVLPLKAVGGISPDTTKLCFG
ncbi:NHLP leader peptide family RiPP precursor [Tumebacillus flagellatus]|uniref:Nitrile hydratase alpha/Thiocyanate hydrolase gamma domain-containing protein n=1 Tax=Tumebacillus flagellatus TaxID=1157490 RepID=A0A074M4I6_9BACL|nr:NHLP leader peptide family RiPP precursor [Tumebacillus flagellatus]KEO80922.1 hypothetical protein EL26_23615 [Tumebacillus flagellatus]